MHIWIGGVIGRVYDRIVQDQFENHSQSSRVGRNETSFPFPAPTRPNDADLQFDARHGGDQRGLCPDRPPGARKGRGGDLIDVLLARPAAIPI